MTEYTITEVLVKKHKITFEGETAYRQNKYAALQWLAKKITVQAFDEFCNNQDWEDFREFYIGYKQQVYNYLLANVPPQECKDKVIKALKLYPGEGLNFEE